MVTGLEPVLLWKVGPVIAKGILKLWLRDYKTAEDVGGSLIEVITARFGDTGTQRSIYRQFEAIGDRAAKSLLPLFEEERRLPDNDKEAVALAVAETLNWAGIDAKLLAEKNLDPEHLGKYLLTNRAKTTRDFSDAATALYDRIIDRSAAYIVDIASGLPSFNEQVLGEILRRESDLIDKTNEILERIRVIHEASQQANPQVENARFEEKYRLAIARRLDRVDLFGLDLGRREYRSQNLRVAYVSLLAAQYQGERPKASRGRSTQPRRQRGAGSGENYVIDPAEAIVARTQRLLIRAQAGAGKTTLLKWLAVHAARKTLTGNLAELNEAVPFFIPLRSFAEATLPSPEDFAKIMAPQIADTMPKGWAHRCLETGRAFVLIDSVDEVPHYQRETVHDWIKELAETYGRSRFVVTSRPSAIEEGWMDPEGFDDAELQSMELGDILTLIENWHVAVAQEVQSEEEKSELPSLANTLKNEVESNPSLRELASSPLLCAALCALNRDRNRHLPADRIELYDALCRMLLERRATEQHLQIGGYPNLTYLQMEYMLKDLAYWMLRNGWVTVARAEVEGHLQTRLPHSGIGGETTAGDVLRLFIDRSGLVREPIVGQLDFVHRTFQEFLAAKAIIEEGDTGVLLQNAHDDKWREVIILASGLATARVREEIISAIVQRGDQEEPRRHVLHLLAVACLERRVGLNPDIFEVVNDRLSKLPPPKNMTEAKAMASAGDIASQYLASRKRLRAVEAAACVRALCLIGSQKALEVLRSYRGDARTAVVKELLNGMDYFDKAQYPRAALADLPLESLSVQRIPSLDGVGQIMALKSLTIADARMLSDLGPLAGLTNLQRLAISNLTGVSDLGPLAELMDLESLDLGSLPSIGDIGPLAGLTGLQTLELADLLSVGDVEPLTGVTGLRTLGLRDLYGVSDLGPLAGLTNLQELTISNLPRVSDLGPLAGLTNLQKLTISNLPRVSNLGPLASLTNLSTLALTGLEDVGDLGPLAELKSLSTLHLRSSFVMHRLLGVGTVKFSRPFSAPVAERLSLNRPLKMRVQGRELTSLQNISDLGPLAGLTGLQMLELTGLGSVRDLGPLAGLTELQWLELIDLEKVSDLGPLAGLTRLNRLEVSGLPVIRDIGPLGGLTRLQRLELIDMENITDLGPLAGLRGLRFLFLDVPPSVEVESVLANLARRGVQLSVSPRLRLAPRPS